MDIVVPMPKIEARSLSLRTPVGAKYETNSKTANSKAQNQTSTYDGPVLIIVVFNFVFCFGFRFSDFAPTGVRRDVLTAWEL
jgi:hypothetical protein